MALPNLNWYFVGAVACGYTGSVSGALQAIWRLGTATAYPDGTPRVPGTGSAWTWERETSGATTFSAYGVPPINALSMAYILGGSTSAVAPGSVASNMLGPDTYAASAIYYGMNRAAGAFAGWSAATPFSNAGTFSKYWTGTQPIGTTFALVTVAMWESEEGVVIQFWDTESRTNSVAMGALFDPLSYQSGVSSESDGRLYYMFGSGSVNRMISGWLGGVGGTSDSQLLGYHQAGVNQYHGGFFSPGTNTVATTARFGSLTPSINLTSANGALAQIPYALTNSSGNFLGVSRGFYMVRDYTSQLEVRSASGSAGSTFGYGGIVSDAILFTRT